MNSLFLDSLSFHIVNSLFIYLFISKPYENKCFPEFFISEFSLISHRQFVFYLIVHIKTIWKQMIAWILYFWIPLLFTSSIRFYLPSHSKTIWKQMLSWILYFWILIPFTSSIRFYSPVHLKTIWTQMLSWILYFWILLFSSPIRLYSIYSPFHIKTIWKQMLPLILYFWILILFASSIRFYSPLHIKQYENKCLH